MKICAPYTRYCAPARRSPLDPRSTTMVDLGIVQSRQVVTSVGGGFRGLVYGLSLVICIWNDS